MMEAYEGCFLVGRLCLAGALSHSCTKLGNHDFVSKFPERKEDNTV